MRTAVVVPNYDGERWLRGCLGSLARQTQPPAETIVVDNGSRDGSLALLAAEFPAVRVLALGRNTGFAAAANAGVRTAEAEAVALVNTDVELEPDWLARLAGRLEADAGLAAVACKMLDLADRGLLYDAGDVLRRDGACEQRGRFKPDTGAYDVPGEVWGACAGAAIYRREAVLAAGGFDERFFMYLEDVDLSLRLRLAGWRCGYEPAVALHAGGGTSGFSDRGVPRWVARNTLLLVAKAFPARWLPLVAYRQLGWAYHALRAGELRTHLAGLAAALPLLPAMLRERGGLRRAARVPVARAVPAVPVRGPAAGGHPRGAA